MEAKQIAIMANGCKIPTEKLEEMIKVYAKQKCKEQRELCNKNMLRQFTDGSSDIYCVINSPEPKIQ